MINVPNSIKEALSMNERSDSFNKSKDSLNINTRTEDFNKTDSKINNYNNEVKINSTIDNKEKVRIYDNLPKGQSIIRGQKISLSKLNPSINDIDVCITYKTSNNLYDLDSEAFLLGENEKVLGEDYFVFYNQKATPDNAVKYLSNDSEKIINVKLKELNEKVKKIVFVLTINEAIKNNFNFSGVSNAIVKIIDKSQNKELVRFELTEYYKEVISMMVGEIYFKNGEWRFNAIGNGTKDDLLGLCSRFGVDAY